MASKTTANYKLCQWEPTDPVIRTDFNDDNAKIDAGMKTLRDLVNRAQTTATEGKNLFNQAFSANNLPFACGYYIGDNAVGRVISLGFTPRAVILARSDGMMCYNNLSTVLYGGVAILGKHLSLYGSTGTGTDTWDDQTTALAVVDGGFRVNVMIREYMSILTNNKDSLYYYVALK